MLCKIAQMGHKISIRQPYSFLPPTPGHRGKHFHTTEETFWCLWPYLSMSCNSLCFFSLRITYWLLTMKLGGFNGLMPCPLAPCIYIHYIFSYPSSLNHSSKWKLHSQLSEMSHTRPLCKLHGIMMTTPFVGLLPFKVHLFHFVLASSSPFVPFCSLSCIATARTSLTFSLGIPLTLLDCNSWTVWFASLILVEAILRQK